VALTALAPESLTESLKNREHALSNWRQMQLLNALSPWEFEKLPLLDGYLTNSNVSTKVFALRYAARFGRYEEPGAIREAALSENPRVATVALETLRAIGDTGATPRLRKTFADRPDKVQSKILELLGELGKEKDKDFLLNTFAEGRPRLRQKAFLAYLKLTDALSAEFNRFLTESGKQGGVSFPLDWFRAAS
jgi:hypothetical protein